MKTSGSRGVNWGVIIRVGVVVGLIALLVGYALKITYDLVIRGGVVQEGDYARVDLKSMSNFEMDQARGTIEDVPAQYRGLNGKKVIFEGEVAPTGFSAGGGAARTFDLCFSVAKCCFSGPPKVQHFVACRVPEGRKIPQYVAPSAPVKVYGTLRIEPIKDDPAGPIRSLFQMDIERVDPA